MKKTSPKKPIYIEITLFVVLAAILITMTGIYLKGISHLGPDNAQTACDQSVYWITYTPFREHQTSRSCQDKISTFDARRFRFFVEPDKATVTDGEVVQVAIYAKEIDQNGSIIRPLSCDIAPSSINYQAYTIAGRIRADYSDFTYTIEFHQNYNLEIICRIDDTVNLHASLPITVMSK